MPEEINIKPEDVATNVASLLTNGHGTPVAKKKGFLSIYPGKTDSIEDKKTECLTAIQAAYPDNPLWVIMHDGESNDYSSLDEELWEAFYASKDDFEKDKKIALLLVSPGGQAEVAYRMAKLIRNISKDFIVIIPNAAKSAATLLSLGASEIHIGPNADLGPLDVQITDHNEERSYSALDEVQSLDGLFEFATTQVIQTTTYWSKVMIKKKQTIFPSVIDYVTGMMKPLMEKIDTVHYMSLSRTLRIAEEYAYRLLSDKYGIQRAKIIAKRFVENYPYHGFIIDMKETRTIGLTNVKELNEDIQKQCDTLIALTENCSNYLIGKFHTID